MYLEINNKILGNRSIIEYIASSIESKFPDSKDDANKVRTAKTTKNVKKVFSEYYEGWKYDGVAFFYDDIDTILYWMDQEVQLFKKELEYKKWVAWLARMGMTPGQIKRQTNKKSS